MSLICCLQRLIKGLGMKYHFILVWLTVVAVLLIDLFLVWRWRKAGFFHSLTGKVLAGVVFGMMPLVSIVGFIYLGLRMPVTDSSQIYVDFGWFLLFFLIIYSSKLIFSSFHGLQLLVNRLMVKPKEKVHHYPRLSRRKFLSQVGIIMATAPFVTMLFGAFKGRFAFYTRHVRLSFPNLPEGFDGLRIAHISDLHIGSFGDNREPIAEAVRLINAEQPDMILFTGDIVNNFAGELNGWEHILNKLNAPMGKYSILGNHDYGSYSRWKSKADKERNFEGIVTGHKTLGFTLLRNEAVVLKRDGDSIGLGGVENWGTASQPKKGDLKLASRDIQNQPFNILMSHDPDHWDKKVLPQNFFDLTLSGHTHGMQFGIERGDFKWSPAQYVQKRWAGLYREGEKFLYVNRGLGYHGLPARVGMPPEITIIELSRGPLGTESM
jgi:uncharacterized protein